MKERMIVHVAVVSAVLCVGVSCSAGSIASPASKQTEAMAQWKSLKYGMFIHFGMSTFTGREIDPGDKPSTTYAPSDLDVEQWIRVARKAGMKYAVLTAKHVPGHCLWDSKVQWKGNKYDYDVATSGDKTDVVAAFVKACKKYGITPGLYWCLLDYRNNSVSQHGKGNAGKLSDDFFQLAKDQLAELLIDYPDIKYLWLDIPRAASFHQRTELYSHIKTIKRNCIVLFNHGLASPNGPLTIAGCQAAWPTDVLNTERHPVRPGWFSPRQQWQGKTYSVGYEHCDTICRRWFWTHDDKPKPVRQLYHLYKQVTDAGGNLLLNVPPDKTGRIPDYHVKALMELKKAINDPTVFPEPITLNKHAKTSNVHENASQYAGKFALDDNPSTRWATDSGIKSAWLEVDLGKPMPFGRAIIQEAYPELKRVGAFMIEYKDGGQWKACYTGTRIGEELAVTFKPVTAQCVRLNITEATEGPTIRGFQLYAAPLDRGKPTEDQIAWHEMEIEMFVHFGPATWQNREYDNHSTPLSKINPTKLDTDQWCQVAQSFGAKQIIFVAKHVGDFCWWQTETTQYGIKETPYQNGKSDVLQDLSKSCKKYGLKLGIYVYPGNHELGAAIGSGGRTKDPAKQQQADNIYRQQLIEVLSRYGKINEIWFDGSCKTPVKDIIDKYAPHAMIFQGPLATIRWPGNEHGFSPYPAWQTVKKAGAATGVATGRHSDPDGDVWLPMEMDTTLLNKAWFWKANWDHRIKSVDQLMDIYDKSVGRGGVLLLNATPDRTGLIPASHVKRYKEFGEAIRRIYSNKKGEVAGTGRVIELRFDRLTAVNHIITMEDICHGHIVRAYEVDGLIDGQWKTLHTGISIGYKQIDVIETVKAEGLRLRVTQAVDEPIIKSFAAYEAPAKRQATIDTKPTPWQQVAGFKSSKLTDQWQSIDIDLTPYIRQPGQFEVELRKAGGDAKLAIKRSVVVMAGTEAPRLITKLDRRNAWNINRTAAVTPGKNGRTVLRIIVRFDKGRDWTGEAFIRPAP